MSPARVSVTPQTVLRVRAVDESGNRPAGVRFEYFEED
jgi:hypothetical protein